MACLKGLVLLVAVRLTLVASLKTKDLTGNAWLSKDTIKKQSSRRFPSPNWCSATVTSNLGGLGPDTSAAPELRYANIPGVETDERVDSVDLVVTALGGYKSKHPEVNGFNNGGIGDENAGCFGIINLDATDGGASVDLEYKFVEHGTNNVVHVTYWEFVLFDIDMGKNNTAIESLTVYADIDRYLKSPTSKFSETGKLSETGDMSEGVTFTATTVGDGDDNPSDPDSLTRDQIDKTFIGTYLHVDKFKLTFSVTEGGGGRNFMFTGRTMPSDAPEAKPECATGSCVIWGDPHIITFDLHQEHIRQHPKRESLFRTRNWELDEVSVQDTGTFWLVNSETIHMQGTYEYNTKHPNMTSLDAFAVGGPFLDDNVLVFRPLSAAVTWNNLEILSSLPSEFSNRYVSARYHKGAEMVKDGSMAPAIDVHLPNGVKLTINRWVSMLEVKIDMCLEEGQDGQCGNFNDNVTDDNEEQIMARIGHKLLPHESMAERYSFHVKMIDSKADEAAKHEIPEWFVAKRASEVEIEEEKHVTGLGKCGNWCETHMDPWTKKCDWPSLECSACGACDIEENHASTSCQSWCETHMDAWDKKCGWPSLVCSTCEACGVKA